MNETDKIITFVEGLRSAMQSEVNYHMPDKLEDTMKMVINFDNAYFHKMTTASKSITKSPPRRELLSTNMLIFIFLYFILFVYIFISEF